jgi:uncharacterized phage protein gp47/JayE
MTFARPTLLALINRDRDDVLSRLVSTDPLRRSDAEVYSRTLAGAAHGLYGFIDWLSRQCIYDTAESDILERWAAIWGLTRRAATAATGTATFTGSNGAVIPSATPLTAWDSVVYVTTASATISAGTASAPITASIVGLSGNRAAGETLNLGAAIAGVNASVIASALAGGADIESDDDLRYRFLLRIRQPPHGGSRGDYIQWALEVAGIAKVWVSPLENGPGTVIVRIMTVAQGDADPTGSADITAVANHIDPVRPVTAHVTVAGVTPIQQPITISGLLPATDANKLAIQSALADTLRNESEPGSIVYYSHLVEAIASVPGVVDFALTNPSTNLPAVVGEVYRLGAITWI